MFRTITSRRHAVFASKVSGNWNTFETTRSEYISGHQMHEVDMSVKKEQNWSSREHRNRRRGGRRRRRLSLVTSHNLDKVDLLKRFTLDHRSLWSRWILATLFKISFTSTKVKVQTCFENSYIFSILLTILNTWSFEKCISFENILLPHVKQVKVWESLWKYYFKKIDKTVRLWFIWTQYVNQRQHNEWDMDAKRTNLWSVLVFSAS